jgi:hypothetical protein
MEKNSKNFQKISGDFFHFRVIFRQKVGFFGRARTGRGRSVSTGRLAEEILEHPRPVGFGFIL